jgi:BirA family biotin operon repressor/biotin-[acetyl-CoA-carboxylase] ligase
MDRNRGALPVLIRTIAETGSTNADLLALARSGTVEEGFWLCAERQTAGRGRQGRTWDSPVGNFYGSTMVRLRPGDPAAATLGFAVSVALADVVTTILSHSQRQSDPGRSGLQLKWPNDLLFDGAKLSGILLERAGETVIVGVGVNLAHHPDLADRRTTSLAAIGVMVSHGDFAEALARRFADWLSRWRADGFRAVRDHWLAQAHPPGTPLRASLPDGSAVEGCFDDLDADGALIVRLAGGGRRAIHAGDVFLV